MNTTKDAKALAELLEPVIGRIADAIAEAIAAKMAPIVGNGGAYYTSRDRPPGVPSRRAFNAIAKQIRSARREGAVYVVARADYHAWREAHPPRRSGFARAATPPVNDTAPWSLDDAIAAGPKAGAR